MLSPINARRSGICSGVTPHLAVTAASSYHTGSPRALAESTRTCGLSTSSASKPGTSRRGSRSASKTRITRAIWLRRSSGIPGRVSL